MRKVQYFRGNEFLGDDTTIGEYQNDHKRCPYCHTITDSVYCRETRHEDGLWYDDPIGCWHCVESYDEYDDGYSYEYDPVDEAIDRAYEDRIFREYGV